MAEPSLTSDVALKVGPWGCSGGSSFDIIGESTSQLITKVVVNAGDVIDSLEIFYSVDGNKSISYKAGGTGGEYNKFELSHGEYINKIFGSVKDYINGETCITQLGFTTNLMTHGPFGQGGGVGFTIPVVNGRIVGFFGQYSNYINAIGVSLALK